MAYLNSFLYPFVHFMFYCLKFYKLIHIKKRTTGIIKDAYEEFTSCPPKPMLRFFHRHKVDAQQQYISQSLL